MVLLLPKWIMRRYVVLWKEFKTKKFSYDDARKILNEEDERIIGIILSELRKAGWIDSEQDPKDLRKRLYYLVSPEKALSEVKNDL